MKTARILLLTLAAIAVSAPLAAEDINAPEPRWQNPAAVETSTPDVPRLAEDVQEVSAQQPPATAQQKSSEPQKQPTPEQKKPAKDQETHQRVLGLAPMFNVVNDASKARPLSVGEKWKLFYRQTYDPFQFLATGVSAAISQADNQFPEYGQGMQGYGKRYGASLADSSLGAFFGNFALPSLLHDDPRYFRKGSGPFKNRLLHAIGASVITRRDNGSSRPNYSNVFGNLIGCAIGNVYYPQSERTVSDTVSRGLQVTAAGSIGGIFQEFWPDIQKKLFKHHDKVPEINQEGKK